MTLLFVMNLGMAWGAVVGPTFNPAWISPVQIYGATQPPNAGTAS